MKILAIGPQRHRRPSSTRSATAGHEVIIGRPLDQPGRAGLHGSAIWSRPRATPTSSSPRTSTTITRGVMEAAPQLRLVIVPFIGTDKIDLAGRLAARHPRGQQPDAGELHRGGRGHHRRSP